ncbi:unnamed protein product [Rotaria magnacalcarata]|uniref:Uncharacterized protein n=3 Tax=Rotaria magnacalcarata TaxID=392030 RepID=A0A814YHX2_9BILA|nr:unnamed protein product [Rotaria magnacalcarata]CAF1601763.1 unnamed protein product [Rotaria magnacalcarata]CAF2033410.1 unnamed protein product [Rotaria magnacalcarata]CAF2061042.1 unnamed protein product [Rotaria magnacalcarata]CAF2154858.1 unnamed protein product [Rotaria magnacalcarata]
MASMLFLSASVYSSRSFILFIFGCTLAVVLMSFQYEHKLSLFNSPRLMLTLPALSLVSVCGFGAALVGLLYPKLMSPSDQTSTLDDNDDTIQKSRICKSLVIFVGINHLCAKIPFQSDLHFSIIVVCLCIGFWWCFDRSIVAFTFSSILSLILTMTTEILLRAGALEYTNSDLYLKTCVPCLTFAGAILTIQITKFLSQNNQSLPSNIQIQQDHLHNE